MSKEQCPEFFADELGGIMLGFPMSKLTFSAIKNVGTDGSIDRANVITLAIPTQALFNACKAVMDKARHNQEMILGGASASEANLLVSLQSEPAVSLPKTSTVTKKKLRRPKAIPNK